MSTQTENRALLATIFDALSVGDARPFVDAMADRLRWRFAGEWSWARDWGATKQEVRDNLLRPLMAQFSDYRASADEILADGDRVVVRAHADATTIRAEMPTRSPTATYFTSSMAASQRCSSTATRRSGPDPELVGLAEYAAGVPSALT
jgi:ketosteroid isomerase-like protein